MYVELLEHSSMYPITKAAGVCRNSADPVAALKHALAAGHRSLLEHWTAAFEIDGISRACSHQFVRTRIGWSPTQQSQRHLKIDDTDDWYVTPTSVFPSYHTYLQVAKKGYDQAIADGVPLEDARYLLPNGATTKIILTTNAAALQLFFQNRCCTRAQWEIRDLAKEMLRLCQKAAPMLFGSYPNCDICKEPCK